jgi:fibronectin-binding autotransporter adhesin
MTKTVSGRGSVGGSLRVALLAASSALALQAEAANVAIVQGGFYTNDLANQLTLSGNTVTLITSYTAASLAGYDAVIHYGNSFTDTAALQTYVFGGGTLIMTPWADQNFLVPANIDVYNNNTGIQFSALNPAVTVLDPGSPLLAGVSFPAAGTTNIGRILLTTYVGNGGEVARWSDGYGLVGLTNYGTGTSIFINMHVITSDTAYTVINQAWAATLFDNAVNFNVVTGCPVSAGADICLIDSTTNQATAIDALGGTDTLQVGGAANFAFDVAAIGTTFTNFETFQKTGASDVTLTGVAGVAANWDIQAGTLTASTGDNIFDTSNVNVGGGATFALTASETIGSLSGSGNVNLNANTLTTGGDNLGTIFAGTISGTGGLTKTGTGQFDLNGTNTYTGTTTLLSGQLSLNSGTAIADTGAVVVNGGTLAVFASETIGSLAGTGGGIGTVNPGGVTLTTGGNNASTTYAGSIFHSGIGTFGITKVGTGNMTLSGNNTYTGTTFVSGGILTAAGGNGIGDLSQVNVAATFALADSETIGSLTGAGLVTLGANTLTTGGDNTSTVYAGTMSGTGGMTKTGSGQFDLNGTNTYTGTTTLLSGQLTLNSGSAIADTGAVVVNGGTLAVFASETIGSLAGTGGQIGTVNPGGVTLTTGGNNASTTYAGSIFHSGVGTFSLTKTGTGNMTLSGNNTYTGTTSIFGGTLTAAGGNGIGDASHVIISGGTLALSAGETIGSLTGSDFVTLGSNTLTTGGNNLSFVYAGSISGTGGLTKIGTGNQSLIGTNTYTGTTTINAGVLTAGGGSAIADTGAVVVNAPGQFTITSSETIGSLAGSGAVDLSVNTLTTGGNNSSTTYSGSMTGAGGLTKTGTGTMVLSGANTYTGSTFVSGGILSVQNSAALGTAASGTTVANGAALEILGGGITIADALALNGTGVGNGGALRNVSGNNNYSGAITLGSASRINSDNGILQIDGAIGGAGQNLTVGGAGHVIINTGLNTGSGTLTKDGDGILALNGVDTFTGNVTVNQGTLQLSFGGGPINSAIGDAASVTLNGGILNVQRNETIGSLSGAAGTLLNIDSSAAFTTGGNNASTSFLGSSLGGGALIKTGTGTFSTLNLGHSGLTTINAGTMNINGNVAGSVVINSGAVLSGNTTIAGSLTLNAGGVLRPGNSPGTTIVGGAFIGGGTILTEVQFNNAGAPINGTTHDFLSIGGNVSGTTLLNVVPFAPSNAPVATTGNGIELVRVGGTTTAGAFQLAAPLVFGSIEYTLNYLPNYSGALDGYFLQSRASASMHGEAALLAAGQAMVAGCLTGQDALIGDGNAHRGRVWAKAGRGNRDTGADTGVIAGNDYRCATGGVDVLAEGALRLGLSGGFGVSDSTVQTPSGAGRLEGDGGIVQLYAEFHSGGFFANLTGGWGAFDYTFDGPGAGPMGAQLNGTIGALQLGHHWAIDWFRLGAIGEVAYNSMDCRADCILVGTQTDANRWFYKGTVRADTVLSDGELKPYLALSLANGGSSTVTNGPASLTTDTQALHLIAKAGANIMVDTQTAIFLDAGMTEGLDNDIKGWDVGAGIKAMW